MQLITQDQEEAAHDDLYPLRQASGQYLTSSRFKRHFLRQTMVRPHVAHGLAGKPDLFPRKFSAGFGTLKKLAWVKSLLSMTTADGLKELQDLFVPLFRKPGIRNDQPVIVGEDSHQFRRRDW